MAQVSATDGIAVLAVGEISREQVVEISSDVVDFFFGKDAEGSQETVLIEVCDLFRCENAGSADLGWVEPQIPFQC